MIRRRPHFRALCFATGVVVLAAALGAASGQAQPPAATNAIATLAGLQSALSNHLAEPRFAGALWGVKIVSLDSGKTLFEHNAGKLFSPASNSKLYTTALGLDYLGGDHRIRTSLYATKRPTKSGTLQCDLIVFGRGDPTFNARLHGSNIFKALEPLVAALTNAGVKRIKGDLVGDESFFRGPPMGSGWAWDDLQYYYGAEISALTINDNTLQVSIKPGDRLGSACQLALSPATSCVVLSNRTQTVAKGGKRNTSLYRPLGENVVYVSGQMPMGDAGDTNPITMHNPAQLFVTRFKEALARRGIKVAGRPRSVNWLDRQAAPLEVSRCIELGSVESPPLRDIVREIEKPSQNLYTDLLLAHIGALVQATNAASASGTSEEAGIRELNRFLAEVGIEKGHVLFEEGSGLSRDNLTTPSATVRLLEFMSRHRWAEAYRDALPIAGVDGTLKNRMKDTPAAGNVRAKTGTLRWANSLSGYVTTAAGERLVFSIMLNRYENTTPGRPTRTEIDALAVMLASFTGPSGKEGD